jgi:D-beta-D-heptose 7-phosphate kinase / D-beta-D-heptose 1-phosphate adenosyltransferase
VTVKDLGALESASVLVVGDIMLDRYIWGKVGRISPEAPVQVVLAQEKTNALGGAANVANNIASLGAKALLVGLCGSDPAGDKLGALLKDSGIDGRLIVTRGRPTITKTRIMAQGQQLLRIDEEQTASLTADEETRLAEALMNTLNGVGAVILSDYAKGALTATLCKKVIDQAHVLGIPVIVDPKGTQWDRYRGATCITPNMSEFSAMIATPAESDAKLLEQAQALCREIMTDRILVTRGAKGMVLVSQESEPLVIPSQAKEVFDVSGAGDTVIATLGVAVAAGLTWTDAVSLANTAAGVVVGKLGTQPITRPELQAELSKQSINQMIGHHEIEDALRMVKQWRLQRETIVFTNGCFDLLHVGHVKLIESAAKEGDRLIIGLNSDASVSRLKGDRRPIITQKERAKLLSAIAGVDMVIIFDEDTPLNLIEKLRPDVLVKGSDYALDEVVGGELVASYGGRVALVQLEKGYSTTSIVQKIAG